MARVFLRFVVSARDSDSGYRLGVFHAARELEERDVLSAEERNRLGDLGVWFRENLLTPERFSRKRNANHRNARGLSWFRDSAKEHLTHAYEVLAVLERAGVAVEVLRTSRPGFVVFEDEYQIVAEPFSDTPV